MEERIRNILISIFTIFISLAIVFYLGIYVLDKQMESPEWTYEFCCGGNPCSDTYYSKEDGLCHLTLCENNPLMKGKSNCTYQSNITTISGG